MLEKIKQHVKDHKEAYIVGVTFASVTCLYMRVYECSAVKHMPKKCCGRITDQSQTNIDSYFSGGGIEVIGGNNYGNVFNKTSSKSLSYIISQKGTDNWWRSQADYARERGLSEADVSKYFTKGRPLPNGETLIREGVAN